MSRVAELSRTVRAQAADSLARNAFFLTVATALNSGFGFLFWTLSARLFPSADVGYATALISASTLVASVASLGLTRTVIRYLASSPDQRTTVSTMLALVGASSFVVSVVVALMLPVLGVVDLTTGAFVLFVVLGVVTSLRGMLDNVFVAKRVADRTVIENFVAGVSRVGLPFALVGGGALGVFGAHVIGFTLSLGAGALMLSRLGHRWRTRPKFSDMDGKWQFSLGSYASDLIGNLPVMVLPLIVTARLGPANAAYWYMAAMIAQFVFLVCSSIAQSLLAEVSSDESRMREQLRRASWLTVIAVGPLTVVLAITAPWVLHIFGAEYVEAAPALRLMMASVVLIACNYVTGTILNIYKRVGIIFWVNVVNAAIVLGGAATFVTDLTSLGWVWVAGEVANATLFLAGAVWVMRREAVPSAAADGNVDDTGDGNADGTGDGARG